MNSVEKHQESTKWYTLSRATSTFATASLTGQELEFAPSPENATTSRHQNRNLQKNISGFQHHSGLLVMFAEKTSRLPNSTLCTINIDRMKHSEGQAICGVLSGAFLEDGVLQRRHWPKAAVFVWENMVKLVTMWTHCIFVSLQFPGRCSTTGTYNLQEKKGTKNSPTQSASSLQRKNDHPIQPPCRSQKIEPILQVDNHQIKLIKLIDKQLNKNPSSQFFLLVAKLRAPAKDSTSGSKSVISFTSFSLLVSHLREILGFWMKTYRSPSEKYQSKNKDPAGKTHPDIQPLGFVLEIECLNKVASERTSVLHHNYMPPTALVLRPCTYSGHLCKGLVAIRTNKGFSAFAWKNATTLTEYPTCHLDPSDWRVWTPFPGPCAGPITDILSKKVYKCGLGTDFGTVEEPGLCVLP